MKEILVVMDIEKEHKSLFNALGDDYHVSYIHHSQVTKEDAIKADAIVGNINPSFLKDCPNLKLMQLNSAGMDGYTDDGVLPTGCVLKNATGAYGLAISEHMIGMVLSLLKKLNKYQVEQQNHNWTDLGSVRSIEGATTLVVGLGDIGGDFGRKMHALGSRIIGIKRDTSVSYDYVNKLSTMDDFYELLGEADIVASALPGGASTTNLYDKKAFDAMKQGALFINVGRGTAVDQDALYTALESGHLAGAAIDVTNPEPLPSDHKLWDAPNLIITPHISGQYHLRATHDRIVNIAIKNIKEYL